MQKLFLISRGESLYSYQSGDLSLFYFSIMRSYNGWKVPLQGMQRRIFQSTSTGLHREYNAAWLSRAESEWTSSECECVYATLLTTWRFSPFHPFHDQIKKRRSYQGVCVWCVHIISTEALLRLSLKVSHRAGKDGSWIKWKKARAVSRLAPRLQH